MHVAFFGTFQLCAAWWLHLVRLDAATVQLTESHSAGKRFQVTCPPAPLHSAAGLGHRKGGCDCRTHVVCRSSEKASALGSPSEDSAWGLTSEAAPSASLITSL